MKILKKSFALLLAILILLLTGCSKEVNTMTGTVHRLTGTEPRWTIGFGQREIELPDEGPLYIAGYNNGLEITGVLDLQRATAVWLDVGGEGVLLIGVDCVGLSSHYIAEIRSRLTEKCAEWGCVSVNVYSTHTHAGVDTLGLWGPPAVNGKNDAFMENVLSAACEAAEAAYENRRTGSITYSKADTGEIQRDSRLPIVCDTFIHQLRFTPDDGSSGVRIVSYEAHAEALRSENTLVSRDYPGVIADLLKEQTGDDMLYMPAAVGGLIMTHELHIDKQVSLQITGSRLTENLLSIPESEEIPVEPALSLARVSFHIPLDNAAFMYYRFLGILDTDAVPGTGATGYDLRTELSVMTIGQYTLTLIPGELFPELAYGGYLEKGAAKDENAVNPIPLAEIAASFGRGNLLICGLANDEIGYIVPPNDFLLNEKHPYFEKTNDFKGENHYEETNSVGPLAAQCIADAFTQALTLLSAR